MGRVVVLKFRLICTTPPASVFYVGAFPALLPTLQDLRRHRDPRHLVGRLHRSEGKVRNLPAPHCRTLPEEALPQGHGAPSVAISFVTHGTRHPTVEHFWPHLMMTVRAFDLSQIMFMGRGLWDLVFKIIDKVPSMFSIIPRSRDKLSSPTAYPLTTFPSLSI